MHVYPVIDHLYGVIVGEGWLQIEREFSQIRDAKFGGIRGKLIGGNMSSPSQAWCPCFFRRMLVEPFMRFWLGNQHGICPSLSMLFLGSLVQGHLGLWIPVLPDSGVRPSVSTKCIDSRVSTGLWKYTHAAASASMRWLEVLTGIHTEPSRLKPGGVVWAILCAKGAGRVVHTAPWQQFHVACTCIAPRTQLLVLTKSPGSIAKDPSDQAPRQMLTWRKQGRNSLIQLWPKTQRSLRNRSALHPPHWGKPLPVSANRSAKSSSTSALIRRWWPLKAFALSWKSTLRLLPPTSTLRLFRTWNTYLGCK